MAFDQSSTGKIGLEDKRSFQIQRQGRDRLDNRIVPLFAGSRQDRAELPQRSLRVRREHDFYFIGSLGNRFDCRRHAWGQPNRRSCGNDCQSNILGKTGDRRTDHFDGRREVFTKHDFRFVGLEDEQRGGIDRHRDGLRKSLRRHRQTAERSFLSIGDCGDRLKLHRSGLGRTGNAHRIHFSRNHIGSTLDRHDCRHQSWTDDRGSGSQSGRCIEQRQRDRPAKAAADCRHCDGCQASQRNIQRVCRCGQMEFFFVRTGRHAIGEFRTAAAEQIFNHQRIIAVGRKRVVDDSLVSTGVICDGDFGPVRFEQFQVQIAGRTLRPRHSGEREALPRLGREDEAIDVPWLIETSIQAGPQGHARCLRLVVVRLDLQGFWTGTDGDYGKAAAFATGGFGPQ